MKILGFGKDNDWEEKFSATSQFYYPHEDKIYKQRRWYTLECKLLYSKSRDRFQIRESKNAPKGYERFDAYIKCVKEQIKLQKKLLSFNNIAKEK